MNLCAFVKALSSSAQPVQIVSVLSAATNHFSADKEKRPCSQRREASFEYQEQENKDFLDTMSVYLTEFISATPAGFLPFV